jgi:hypothetical protein
LVQLCRFALAAVFLSAAFAALSSPYEFVPEISSLVARGRGAIVASIVIILIEIIAAILLIIPATARVGGWWSVVLLLSFTLYPLYYLHVFGGGTLACSCFGGIIASDRAALTVVRNLVLLVMSAIVGLFYRRRR